MNQTIRNLLLLFPSGGFRVTDVPQSEGDALIWLFKATNGPNWTDHTNWLQTHTVGNWFGITVAGGHVTVVNLPNNNLNGNIGVFPIHNLPSLTTLNLKNNAGITGNPVGYALPASLVLLYLYNTSLSGDMTGWAWPALLADPSFNNTGMFGVPDISANTAMSAYDYKNCALTQANVDAVLLSVYNRRMAFTDAVPALDISGTNVAPSGVYADEDPPVTGKGMAFELVNDPEGELFRKWVITFTP